MPLDPPEKLTVGEHLPAKGVLCLGVADTRVPHASDSTVTPFSFIQNWNFDFLAKIISPVSEIQKL